MHCIYTRVYVQLRIHIYIYTHTHPLTNLYTDWLMQGGVSYATGTCCILRSIKALVQQLEAAKSFDGGRSELKKQNTQIFCCSASVVGSGPAKSLLFVRYLKYNPESPHAKKEGVRLQNLLSVW